MTTVDGGTRSTVDGRARTVVVVLCWIAIVGGIVLRFIPRADLWLDEALSVNIADLGLGDIGEALRHDGHPPLYYVLLHGWIAIGGDSSWWVRAMSGVLGVASIPLGYVAGRRIARRSGAVDEWTSLAGLLTASMVAIVPFAVRYGSEARMYSLLILLVLAGYLLFDDLMRSRRSGRAEWATAAGLALVTAALLWTQYWSMWLLATVGLIVLYRMWRPGPGGRRGPLLSLGALVAGGVLFLPWLPSMLYQAEHTGTPWGEVIRPTTVFLLTIIDFAGKAVAEPQLLSYVLILLIVVATFGVVVTTSGPGDRPRELIQIEPRTTPRVRYELVVLVGTLMLGSLGSALTGATFNPRYAAVVFPFFAICIAAGLSLLRPTRVMAVVLAVLLVGAAATVQEEISSPRTQAGKVADRIVAETGGDPSLAVVIACPDQLSPATERALRSRTDAAAGDWVVVPFPTGSTPTRVDWVDYAERNDEATVAGFLAEQAERIPDEATVFVVFTSGYKTFRTKCEQLAQALADARGGDVIPEVTDDGNYFEHMGLWVLPPTG